MLLRRHGTTFGIKLAPPRVCTPMGSVSLRFRDSLLTPLKGIRAWFSGLWEELARSRAQQAAMALAFLGTVAAINEIRMFIQRHLHHLGIGLALLTIVVLIAGFSRRRKARIEVSRISAYPTQNRELVKILSDLLTTARGKSAIEIARDVGLPYELLQGLLDQGLDTGYLIKVYGAYEISPSMRAPISSLIKGDES